MYNDPFEYMYSSQKFKKDFINLFSKAPMSTGKMHALIHIRHSWPRSSKWVPGRIYSLNPLRIDHGGQSYTHGNNFIQEGNINVVYKCFSPTNSSVWIIYHMILNTYISYASNETLISKDI